MPTEKARSVRGAARASIVPLTEREAAAVAELAREPVELLLPVRARARIEGEDTARRRAAPPPMLNAGHDLPFRRPIAGQLVGDHDAGRPHFSTACAVAAWQPA